jgi:hypothetical protein
MSSELRRIQSGARAESPPHKSDLLGVACTLLTIPLPRERFFGALLFARFEIKGVSLDLLNDVFLLNFALEAAQSAF